MKFPNQFIAATKEYNTREKYIPLYYFRRSFMAKEGLIAARLKAGALGLYALFLNGEEKTKGPLAPYRANPDDYVYYDEYDLPVREGKNALCFLLGNGLQSSIERTWNFTDLPWRSAPALFFSLELIYEDGSVELIESDEQTLVSPSPIIFNDFHYGEYYDARLEQKGWDLPDFDDSAWAPALLREPPKGEVRRCEAEPIAYIEERKPLKIKKRGSGWVYDFGVNDSGLCRLSIDGEAGQKVVLKYFETKVNGQPYYANIRFDPKDRFQEDEYICAGGKAEHTARFTYHGFRYVYVEGITKEQATEELLTYRVMHSDLKAMGQFKCDNQMINALQECTLRSDYSNFFYFPTDCPQREKNGWTADAALSAEQMLLNMNPEKSYKEWMRNIYKAMDERGALPGIIPTGGWGFDWGNGPAWDCILVWIPYFTYQYRGDPAIFEGINEPIKRYLSYLDTRKDERGLLAIGLGDWCQPAKASGDPDVPLIVTDSITALDIARKAAFIFKVLEDQEGTNQAETFAEKMLSSIRTHLIQDGIMKGDTQTGQAMGLFHHIFEADQEEYAFRRLLELIHKAGDHMATGVLGGRVIFRVLADRGEADLALHMMLRPEFPSYGNWIIRGATTLWEMFTQEGEQIASRNHHFWGDISAWFYRYLGGMEINPDATDIYKVNIKPIFASAVGHVEASHTLPFGEVKVEWARRGETIILDLEAPAMAVGEVILPDGYLFADGTAAKTLSTDTFIVKKA